MIVYRLCKTKYRDDLAGKGAEMASGRWNSRGRAVLYTSQSRALCVAEIAVHTPLGVVPDDYSLLTIQIPDDASIQEVTAKDLPHGWKSLPYTGAVQGIGDRFVAERKCLVLRVPSAVIQDDYNILVNPLHKDFPRVKVVDIHPFEFDYRLFKR